jgi:hypothetical protein
LDRRAGARLRQLLPDGRQLLGDPFVRDLGSEALDLAAQVGHRAINARPGRKI